MESWKYCWLLAPVNIWSCCGCICAILSHQKPFFSRQSEGVDPKSSSKSHKSYFCLSFIFIFSAFFTALFVTSLRSRVDHQCQFTTQFLHEIVWSYHGDPWANAAGFCPWQKSDFHQRSAPSLSSRRPLIQLHFFVCCYTTCLTFTYELDHFSGRFRPLWHTCSHSPRDLAQVPNNWLIFVGYFLIV